MMITTSAKIGAHKWHMKGERMKAFFSNSLSWTLANHSRVHPTCLAEYLNPCAIWVSSFSNSSEWHIILPVIQACNPGFVRTTFHHFLVLLFMISLLNFSHISPHSHDMIPVTIISNRLYCGSFAESSSHLLGSLLPLLNARSRLLTLTQIWWLPFLLAESA